MAGLAWTCIVHHLLKGEKPARGGFCNWLERLWKSVKYEEVYLRAYDSVGEARASLGRYLHFYNSQRPHSSLDRRTPDEAYFNPPAIAMAA
jgi:putative transposase